MSLEIEGNGECLSDRSGLQSRGPVQRLDSAVEMSLSNEELSQSLPKIDAVRQNAKDLAEVFGQVGGVQAQQTVVDRHVQTHEFGIAENNE